MSIYIFAAIASALAIVAAVAIVVFKSAVHRGSELIALIALAVMGLAGVGMVPLMMWFGTEFTGSHLLPK